MEDIRLKVSPIKSIAWQFQFKVRVEIIGRDHVLIQMQILDSEVWFHNWETKIECLEIDNWRKR